MFRTLQSLLLAPSLGTLINKYCLRMESTPALKAAYKPLKGRLYQTFNISSRMMDSRISESVANIRTDPKRDIYSCY